MIDRLIYSKHSAESRCGIAYFSSFLAKELNGVHVNSFHGFSKCNEFYINIDIYELTESDVNSLLAFLSNGLILPSPGDILISLNHKHLKISG